MPAEISLSRCCRFAQEALAGVRRSSVLFTRTEGGEAGILVQHFDFAKTNGAQEVQLEEKRTRSVFLPNIGKDVIAIGFIPGGDQITAPALPHALLDLGDNVLDQIENPECAGGLKDAVQFGEDRAPLFLLAQMMQDG